MKEIKLKVQRGKSNLPTNSITDFFKMFLLLYGLLISLFFSFVAYPFVIVKQLVATGFPVKDACLLWSEYKEWFPPKR